MKTNSQIQIGIVLSYVATAINSIITLAFTPLVIRLLGKSEYGLYNISNSVVSYLGLLSFGFSNSFIRFYTRAKKEKDEDEVARVNGVFMIIFTAIAVLAVVAGTVIVMNLDIIFGAKLSAEELQRSRILIGILVVNIAITFPAYVYEANVMANERYLFQKVIYIIKIGLNPFVALPLILKGYGSYGMVFATLLMTIVSLVSNIWYCKKRLKIRFVFKGINIDVFKEIATFSSFIFLNMLVDQINWNLDQLIIGAKKGTEHVAVYSAGSQLNTCYLAVASTVSSVYIPRIHKLVLEGKKKDISDLFIGIGRIQFIILGIVLGGFWLYGKYFIINIFAGKGYENAYYVALWLMAPATIPYMQLLGVEIQRAKNQHKFRSLVYAVLALFNGIVSYLVCSMWGEIGCAAVTGISMLIGPGIIMNWYNHKYVGLDIPRFWKEILSITPSIVMAVIISFIIREILPVLNMATFLTEGIIYVITLGGALWIFGLNEEEKKGICGILFRKHKI